MKRSPALLLVTLALLLVGAEARAQTTGLFVRRPAPARAYGLSGRSAAFVGVDREVVRGFRLAGGGRLALPLADGSSLTLALRQFDVLAPGATVTLTGDAGPMPYTPDLTLFKGSVEGEPGTLVVLAMTPEQVTGSIEHAGRRLVVSPLAAVGGEHVIADEADFPAPAGQQPFECPAEELPQLGAQPPANLPALPENVEATATRLVCHMALDCDYDFFVKEGSDSVRAVNYALTMLGTTSAIYEREINVELLATYLNVWTTGLDPYATGDLYGALSEFQSWWNGYRTGVSRDLAQLVSGRGLGGGIAYLNVLCNMEYGYSVIGNLYGQNTYPTNTTTWDINVMAHELGHNFSSMHTHSCWWQSNGYAPPGALLDSCYTAEGSCYSGTVGRIPADKGTIMSYCHLLAGVTALRLDFHTACKSVMRNASEYASCFAAATVQPPRDLVVTTGAGGASLGWTASPTSGVIRYDVYRSPWQQDLAPAMIGTTTGTSFPDFDIGTFWYKVRAVRASDSSSFSGEMKSTVCGLSAPTQYTVAAQPIAATTADFNEDGILDLAIANFGGNSVSILLGQGAGGVGNGAFAAAVHYPLPAGSYPAAIATADFNGDGLLDLALADEEAGSLSILFGQGTGGVGDGTFAAGPNPGVGGAPWSLVAGDFNADGITDLVAACGAGTVAVCLGQGTGGVPDGTFAPAVHFSCGSGARGMATGDFNSDGIADLTVAVSTGVSILPGLGSGGQGNGTFGAATIYPCQVSPNSVATGDFNADGITDLAVSNSTSGTISVLLGNGSAGHGNGTMAAATHYASGASPYSIAVADWSGDGVADLVVPNGGTTNTLSILPGLETGGVPNGAFATKQPFAAGTQVRCVALGDFNADGAVDVVVTNNTNPGKTSVLLASCPSPLSTVLDVTNPDGGQKWVTGTVQTLGWTKGAGIVAVNVALSCDGGANWQTIAAGVTGTSLDWCVAGPYTTQARIRVYDPSVSQRAAASDSSFTIIPASLLDAGGRLPAGLALRGVWPNPARDAARVWFTLADASPARLDLVDLAGRRVRTFEVGTMGPGLHGVDVNGIAALRQGLYLVRLTQAGRQASGKMVVAR